ncbi:MAG: PIN domain-containing protein [Cyanobacteria bacterium P01_D01_bin.36]
MTIADSGFWIALINNRDTHHERAISVFAELEEELITTWPVVTEVYHFLLTRMSNLAQVNFLKNLSDGAFKVFDLTSVHASQITALIMKYDNLPMDFADASLIVLAEHLGHGRILSVDQRDFDIYRWKNVKPFKNIMFN